MSSIEENPIHHADSEEGRGILYFEEVTNDERSNSDEAVDLAKDSEYPALIKKQNEEYMVNINQSTH